MVEISNAYEKLMLEIHREWMQAEQCIKQAEQINHAVVIPAVKELRYAGRCLINALYLIIEGKNEQEALEYLYDAKFDTNRARHDAVDALVSKIAIDLESVVLAIGPSLAQSNIPKYKELVALLTSIRRKIVVSRGENVDRNAVYERIEQEDLRQLVDMALAVRISEKIAVAIARRQGIRQRAAILFGVFGFAFGLFVLIYHFYSLAH